MKKILVAAVVFVGIVLVACAPVFAKNASPSPSRTPTKQEIKKKLEDQKKVLAEKRKGTITKFWERMDHRLAIIIRNEKRIAEKISKRIEKAANAGKDVTAARAKLEEGKKLVSEAEAMLKDDLAKVNKIISSSVDAKTAAEQIRQLSKDIMAKIRTAHAELVNALKEIRVKPSPSPTSTPPAQ